MARREAPPLDLDELRDPRVASARESDDVQRNRMDAFARLRASIERDFAMTDATIAERIEAPEFIVRLRARDTKAFDELVRALQRRVFSLIVRMLPTAAEAEDVSQEVFVQVFRAIDQFRGESKLSTWVFRIAVNLTKNRALYLDRRHAGKGDDRLNVDEIGERVPLGHAARGTSSVVARPDHLVEGMQVEQIVQAAIAKLEATFRECLLLREVEDMTYDEIAEITGLPVGTVKSRIHRARAAVRESVEAALGEGVGGKVAVGARKKEP